jgi:hypothetical protein
MGRGRLYLFCDDEASADCYRACDCEGQTDVFIIDHGRARRPSEEDGDGSQGQVIRLLSLTMSVVGIPRVCLREKDATRRVYHSLALSFRKPLLSSLSIIIRTISGTILTCLSQYTPQYLYQAE